MSRVKPRPCLALPAGKPGIRWVQHQERELLLIEHPRIQAAFSRQGGQLLHFQPSGERPWLWCAGHWPRGGALLQLRARLG